MSESEAILRELGIKTKDGFYARDFPETSEVRDFTQVEEIFQNEFGITTAEDPKSILVTFGLADCIALAGYNEDQKIGFVTHFHKDTDVDRAVDDLADHLSQLREGQRRTFKVRMAGGVAGYSEELDEKIITKLAEVSREEFNFAIEDYSKPTFETRVRAIGVDTQTGKFIQAYDPSTNPHNRELPSDYKEAFHKPLPSLYYFPKGKIE